MQQHPIVRTARRVLAWYFRGYHRIVQQTPCTLPAEGPAILVCNHISGLDPVMLQLCCPNRLITWMMAREYYEVKALRWMFDLIRIIPVERSGRDLAATRSALRALEEGRVLGIFPEGKIAQAGQLEPFQTGVALVALRSGAPVYPACVEGSMRGAGMLEGYFRPQRGSVAFGPPVALDGEGATREAIEQATQRIQQAVARLQSGQRGDSPGRNSAHRNF